MLSGLFGAGDMPQPTERVLVHQTSKAILKLYAKEKKSIADSMQRLFDKLKKETQTFIWSEDMKDGYSSDVIYLKQFDHEQVK